MCTDIRKSVHLPAPTDPIRKRFGPAFEDCNSSSEFNMDEQVSRKFHEIFAKETGCHIPFLGGDTYATSRTPLCTRKSDYNTTKGREFSFLLKLPFIVNGLLETALKSIGSPPCNHTNLGLDTIQVMPWADDVTQSSNGDLPKDTQMVQFMMPRTFEL